MAPNSPSNVSVGSALRAQRIAQSLSRAQLVALCSWLGLTNLRGRKITLGMIGAWELEKTTLDPNESIFRAISHAMANPESVAVAMSKREKPALSGSKRQLAALVTAWRTLESGDVVSLPSETLTVITMERTRGRSSLSRALLSDGTVETAKTALVRGNGIVFISYNA